MTHSFDLLYGHVKRCVTLMVLVIEKRNPTEEINETYFSMTVACPMHWSVATVISYSQVHAELFEKIKAYWLVTLSCHMDYVYSHVVECKLISIVVEKETD